jgi:hypothetical protein
MPASSSTVLPQCKIKLSLTTKRKYHRIGVYCIPSSCRSVFKKSGSLWSSSYFRNLLQSRCVDVASLCIVDLMVKNLSSAADSYSADRAILCYKTQSVTQETAIGPISLRLILILFSHLRPSLLLDLSPYIATTYTVHFNLLRCLKMSVFQSPVIASPRTDNGSD